MKLGPAHEVEPSAVFDLKPPHLDAQPHKGEREERERYRQETWGHEREAERQARDQKHHGSANPAHAADPTTPNRFADWLAQPPPPDTVRALLRDLGR